MTGVSAQAGWSGGEGAWWTESRADDVPSRGVGSEPSALCLGHGGGGGVDNIHVLHMLRRTVTVTPRAAAPHNGQRYFTRSITHVGTRVVTPPTPTSSPSPRPQPHTSVLQRHSVLHTTGPQSALHIHNTACTGL